MEKAQRTNRDVQHLVSMDFPYVNHFLGVFDSSQQLDITAGSPLTIMVSSYCSGGDHWSMLHRPVRGESCSSIRLQARADGSFCFVNPDHSLEVVNHAMSPTRFRAWNSREQMFDEYEAHSYLCVRPFASSPTGTICRVEKIDERFFSLWANDTECSYPYSDSARLLASSQFNRPFRLADGAENGSCSMLLVKLKQDSASGATLLKRFEWCMPRPNVAFLRAFSVQLLRALDYCHARKLTAHNGERRASLALCLEAPNCYLSPPHPLFYPNRCTHRQHFPQESSHCSSLPLRVVALLRRRGSSLHAACYEGGGRRFWPSVGAQL